MIIPIGHERGTVLRWPFVTLAVIATCIGVYIYEYSVVSVHEEEELAYLEEALNYYFQHPHLELDPRLGRYVTVDTEELKAELMNQVLEILGIPVDQQGQVGRRHQQRKLDELTEAWAEVAARHPLRRWGLTPARTSSTTLVSYMFFHAGVIHLLSNLLILYLAGPPIEDLWGRPFFAVFFVASGVFAGLMHAQHYPNSDIPLIGASGAIAGVMGAFMVRYFRVKIQFFYWLLLLWTGTFKAPAWLMLPLWFVSELISAYAMDQAFQTGGGVAHWAHIWGFVLGAGVAFTMGFFKIEDRFKRRIHASIGLQQNERLAEALEAKAELRLKQARRLLEEELHENPDNREAIVAYWDLGRQQGEVATAIPWMSRLIMEELRGGDRDLAFQHFDELRMQAPQVGLDPRLRLAVAEATERRGDKQGAAEILVPMVEQADSLPPRMLQRIVRIAERTDPSVARNLALGAVSRHDLPGDLKQELERLAAGQTAAAVASDPAPVPVAGGPGPDHPRFKPVEAVPSKLEAEKLVLEVDGQGRAALRLDRIHGIAAGGIGAPGQEAVVDLLLDSPAEGSAQLRVVRLKASRFDPRQITSGDGDDDEALLLLVRRLMDASHRPFYPENSLFAPTTLPRFDTIGAYEDALRVTFAGLSAPSAAEG